MDVHYFSTDCDYKDEGLQIILFVVENIIY